MTTNSLPKKGDFILNRSGSEKGEVRGEGKRCTLTCCNGLRYPVRWPNGKLTWPCTKGMTLTNGEWRIG